MIKDNENSEIPKNDIVEDNNSISNKMAENNNLNSVITKDFKMLRKNRQTNNNNDVYKSIKSNNITEFYKKINKDELNRIVKYSFDDKFHNFWSKCSSDDLYAKLAAAHLSINASRQGSKDEKEQINIINTFCSNNKININITDLNNNALRPVKNENRIITGIERKKEKINKDKCLKSFDGSITGILNGYLTAKVCFGKGGHQDNVFEEEDTIANWWKNNKNKEEKIYIVILIDTDQETQFNNLKNKYNDVNNILIFNHVQFQQYIINNY